MDRNKFRPESPGRLIAIDGDHAFLPDPLPPKWEFSVELWPLLATARERIALVEGVGRGLPEPALLLRPLESREAIQSSALEGTFATPRQLLLFDREHGDSQTDDDAANEQREVFNYRNALEYGMRSELPLSLRMIRETHRILLADVRGRNKAPGQFRKIQVAIGTNRRFVPPPPQSVAECLDAFEKHLHQATPHHPLLECFYAHYQFETIHPFNDGNGRIGRLLLALMIRDRCQLSKPWLFLSEYFEPPRRNTAIGSSRAGFEFCLRRRRRPVRRHVGHQGQPRTALR